MLTRTPAGTQPCAPYLSTRHSLLLSAAFQAAVDGFLRAADARGRASVPLLLLESPPRNRSGDVLALGRGTASRNNAERLWRVPSAVIEEALRVNLLPHKPSGDIAGAAKLALPRLEFALGRLQGRMSGVLACGWLARDALSLRFGLDATPGWNTLVTAAPWPLGVIPHPSWNNGRNGKTQGVGQEAYGVAQMVLLGAAAGRAN